MNRLINLIAVSLFVFSFGCSNQSAEEKIVEYQELNLESNEIKDTISTTIEVLEEELAKSVDSIVIIENNITVETSKSPCMIKEIKSLDNSNYIVVDYTRRTNREEEESGMVIFENKNPKLRTFLINSNTIITIYNWEKNTDIGLWKISLEEFLSDKKSQISDFSKWDISVEDGVVIELKEIYYP